ncbi:PepSY domain-containing protein [uncultured Maritimibacter sp.]|jgi:hypothetical protein|uniref:PepSY domain-containing protein n=1 Tax=uncultured Maritimibacter sp. TaxID=991866 RepID=UPI0026347DFA|nr:PepSY domain-containing protein [uncultured Maritimibacter sp.]
MNKFTLTLAALAVALPAAGFASNDDGTAMAAPTDLAMGTILGTDEASVRNALTGLGYEVRKMDMEDGAIEAYVVKDKFMAEVYVNAKTGEVIKVSGND